MNIAISGYGRMGRMIEQIAKKRSHSIIARVDPAASDADAKFLSKGLLQGVDVVIDFSIPGSALKNSEIVCSAGKKLVLGTTGWYADMGDLIKLAQMENAGVIWSGNFSLGVNIFFSILDNAAKIMNSFTGYDPFIHEYHHNQKADSPSGTAVMLGNILIKNIDRKNCTVTEELKRQIKPDELHISSTRGGSIPGTHIVSFDSLVDTIELKHTARGREGFAEGAVAAAEWIENRCGFFSISDMMRNIIEGDKNSD